MCCFEGVGIGFESGMWWCGVGFEACVGYGFTPQPEKALGHCFHPWRPTGWAFGQAGSGKIYLVGTLVRGCRCAMSSFDLDLTFNLDVGTLTLKI